MIPGTGKNRGAGASKGRLPGGRAFMSRVSPKRLTRIWQEGGPEHPGDGPGDGIGLIDCPGLAGPHARGKSWQALRPQTHRQEEDANRRRLGVYQEMVEWQPAEVRIRGGILAD